VARVDLVDETFVVAAPDAVAAVVHDPTRWAQWWPDLKLTVFMDRGTAGIRWSVTGALHGSTELWLEPVLDGVVVHYYLRADSGGPTPGDGRDEASLRDRRAADRLRHRRARSWKRSVNALKDELEGGRAPGLPRAPR
jgi:hypothetical protein